MKQLFSILLMFLVFYLIIYMCVPRSLERVCEQKGGVWYLFADGTHFCIKKEVVIPID